MPRSAPPPPLSCGSDLETESQTDAFARALGGKGSFADSHPVPAKHAPLTPRIRPAPSTAIHGALAAPGRVLPFFLEFMVGPGTAHHPVLAHRVPAGPGPLSAGLAGLRARSWRLWFGLQLLPAPPPAQFLPPDSTRRDGAGPAGSGGQPGLGLLVLWDGLLGIPLRNGTDGDLLGLGQECS